MFDFFNLLYCISLYQFERATISYFSDKYAIISSVLSFSKVECLLYKSNKSFKSDSVYLIFNFFPKNTAKSFLL